MDILGRLLSPVRLKVCRPTRYCSSEGRVDGIAGALRVNVWIRPLPSQSTPGQLHTSLFANQPKDVKVLVLEEGRAALIARRAQNCRTLPWPVTVDFEVEVEGARSFGRVLRIGMHWEQGYEEAPAEVNAERHEDTAAGAEEAVEPAAVAEDVLVRTTVAPPVPVVV